MGQGVQRGKREDPGGIIGLAEYAEEHREALEYDLLCKTGHSLNDLGGSMSYGALASFLSQLGPDSALMREENPEVASWATTLKTNYILADIFDMLSAINTNLRALASGKRQQAPRPYPRPQKKKKGNYFGFRAEKTASEFRAWIKEKRRKHSGKRN